MTTRSGGLLHHYAALNPIRPDPLRSCLTG